jgi:regulator of protease activity HflC (stomatin/prohibitin superfamily)
MKKILVSASLIAVMFQGCYMEMIDSGEVGVQIDGGKVNDKPVTEGFNFSMNPWAKLTTYNVKAKQLEMSGNNENDTVEQMNDHSVTILTKDNLQIPIDITILYKLKDECAPYVRKEFGEDIIWDNKVVVPVARDVVRGVVGKDADVYKLNQSRELYATEIKHDLEVKVNDSMKKQCVSIEMVSIKDIRLPSQLMDSIMKKNQMEEESRRAELEVKKAQAEANVAIARAKGTAESQLALAKSITPEMIKWKELEIQDEAVKRWDGKMPQYTGGGAVPFINVGK